MSPDYNCKLGVFFITIKQKTLAIISSCISKQLMQNLLLGFAVIFTPNMMVTITIIREHLWMAFNEQTVLHIMCRQAAAVIVRRRFPPLKVWLVGRSEKQEPVVLSQH